MSKGTEWHDNQCGFGRTSISKGKRVSNLEALHWTRGIAIQHPTRVYVSSTTNSYKPSAPPLGRDRFRRDLQIYNLIALLPQCLNCDAQRTRRCRGGCHKP